MSKTWKWILGVMLGLVVLAGVFFLAANFFGYGHMQYWGRVPYGSHPMMDDYSFRNRTPMNDYHYFPRQMMGYGFLPWPLLFFGGFLRLIFPLAVLGTVGYFSYKKGKKDGATEAAMAASASEPESAPEPKEKPHKPKKEA